jgi:hypothetical protein
VSRPGDLAADLPFEVENDIERLIVGEAEWQLGAASPEW